MPVFVTINYRQCSISFSEKPAAEVLRGLSAEGFRWHPVDKLWVRQAEWNDLPEDFCDWLVSHARRSGSDRHYALSAYETNVDGREARVEGDLRQAS